MNTFSIHDQLRFEVGLLPRHRHYVKSWKRLWFMKQLRRAGVCQDDLLYYYQAVVRPVLEYASPCWQASLTKEQTKQLEDYYYYYYYY